MYLRIKAVTLRLSSSSTDKHHIALVNVQLSGNRKTQTRLRDDCCLTAAGAIKKGAEGGVWGLGWWRRGSRSPS